MLAQVDPAGTEPKQLLDLVDMAQAIVLEIGCGEGRLTWRYASAAKRIIGLDPNPLRLLEAQNQCPAHLKSALTWLQSKAEALPFADKSFEVVLLAWSL